MSGRTQSAPLVALRTILPHAQFRLEVFQRSQSDVAFFARGRGGGAHARGDILRFFAECARDGDCLSFEGEGDMGAPVALGEIAAPFFEGPSEDNAGIRCRSAFLN